MAKTDHFQLTHIDTTREFYCERCLADKKSKITVNWTNPEGDTKIICNGCYGLLLSKSKKDVR